jgi:DNA-binding SARP family transcriptional activator
VGDKQFRINILGTPAIAWREQPYKLSRRQARGLLFYLGNELQPVARDRLCFLLWPDIPDTW